MPNEEWKNRNPKFPAVYCAIYPLLTAVANKHGYALAINGSLTHDMDLIAVPWIRNAEDQSVLIEAIMKSLEGTFVHQPSAPTERPHGRTSYTIFLDNHAYIDLSIMEIKS